MMRSRAARVSMMVALSAAVMVALSVPMVASAAAAVAAGPAPSRPGGQQQEQGQAEGARDTLKVAAEDELAPVRALNEDLERRLGEPMESVDLGLIMEGADFFGVAPRGLRWDTGGRRMWFEWRRYDEDETSTFELDPTTGQARPLSEAEAELAPSAGATWDDEHRRAVWTDRGRLLLYEGSTGDTRVMLDGPLGMRPVGFSRAGTEVALLRDNNLFALRLDGDADAPLLRQLTDVRQGQPPREEQETGSQKWVEAQQRALFDVIDRQIRRRDEQRQEARRDRIEPLYLAGWNPASLEPDPELRWAAVFTRRSAGNAETANVPDYVTASGYTEDIRTRTKVGDSQADSRVGVIELGSGRVAWADLGLGDREVTVGGAEWSPDGSRVLVHVRAADNKDRWFAVLTPHAEPAADESDGAGPEERSATGPTAEDSTDLELEVTLVTEEHDDAWINWSVAGGYGWLPDGSSVYFVSERDGRMHLYRVPADGGEATALTRGDFEVFSPRLSPDRSAFIFEASVPSPFEVRTYRLSLDGGEPLEVNGAVGRVDSTYSPDGSWVAGVASTSNRPPELYVKPAGEAGLGRRVTESPSPAFASYPWIEPEIVHFDAADGTPVPARLYVPDEPHPDRPAVIFVHGAGYLHNVHRWWSSYAREYTFHHLLMERGYTVLDIDYRGSAGYGRDWRTAIYRHMGGLDLEDQVDGARYLVEEHGIDAERIGIYGGSYGGFITLMAMFTEPGIFAAGAALRPVTDWAHYNHGYTSNILNQPQDDPDAYLVSSPIYFAEGLEGALLICHGLVDTNVHAQDTIRLAQRLIELRKDDWEVALYPVENHGFIEASSWYDEYRRILKLFEENLKR